MITCKHCGRETPANPTRPYICPCGKSGIYDSADTATANKIALAQAGGPAFPTMVTNGSSGVSLRDYFAANAMAALLASRTMLHVESVLKAETIVAYEIADMMVATRERKSVRDQLLAALKEAQFALKVSGPAKALDWPTYEAAEKAVAAALAAAGAQ